MERIICHVLLYATRTISIPYSCFSSAEKRDLLRNSTGWFHRPFLPIRILLASPAEDYEGTHRLLGAASVCLKSSVPFQLMVAEWCCKQKRVSFTARNLRSFLSDQHPKKSRDSPPWWLRHFFIFQRWKPDLAFCSFGQFNCWEYCLNKIFWKLLNIVIITTPILFYKVKMTGIYLIYSCTSKHVPYVKKQHWNTVS
jgi:hypothetical protein